MVRTGYPILQKPGDILALPPSPFLRIASALPAPRALAEFEPFQAVGPGTYGVCDVADVTAPTLQLAKSACANAWAKKATAGYSSNRRVKAVFFDMDATVVVEESLVLLAEQAGVAEHVAKVTERAMAGELDFQAALRERVALLAGIAQDALQQVAGRLTLARGIQPFVAFCREIGVPCFLVSGGFVEMVEPIARKVGFSAYKANRFEIASGKLTGKVLGSIIDGPAKRAFLFDVCSSIGAAPSEVAAVGDGANDIPMLTSAGVAVGHQPKDILLPHLHAANWQGHHAFLGPLLFGRDISVVRSRPRL